MLSYKVHSKNGSLFNTPPSFGVYLVNLVLKWLLDQDNVAAIPKAASKANQQSNLDALKVKLDDEDRRAIALLPKDQRLVSPDFAPEWD